MKYIIYDTETGDKIPYNCALLELGFFIYDDETNKIVDSGNWKMKPFDDDPSPVDEALTVNHITREELKTFEDPIDVFNKFISILDHHVDKFNKFDKLTPMAFNIDFDNTVLTKWFQKVSVKTGKKTYWGSYVWNRPGIDVFYLAAEKFKKERPSFKNFKQTTLCEYVGIDVDMDKAHSALYDAKLCFKLYHKMGYSLKK